MCIINISTAHVCHGYVFVLFSMSDNESISKQPLFIQHCSTYTSQNRNNNDYSNLTIIVLLRVPGTYMPIKSLKLTFYTFQLQYAVM